MINITKIELLNFRRYRNAEFKFDEPCSVIVARNGVGKSTLFDAITWCFFEVEDYRDTKNKKEEILSSSTKKELKKDGECCVRSTIFLLNTEDNSRYKVEREIDCVIGEEKILYGPSRFTVSFFNSNVKDWEIEEHPESFIENLIPSDLRQFFFFDGENLRKKFDEDTPKYIEEKINEVSRVGFLSRLYLYVDRYKDYLETTKEKTENKKSQLSSLLKKIADGKKLERTINKEITEITNNIADKKGEKKMLDAQSDELAMKEGEELKKDILDLERKRVEEESALKISEEELSGCLLDNLASLLNMKEIKLADSLIEDGREKGDIPPPWTKEDLDKLLEAGRCICSQDLKNSKNSKNIYRNHILKLSKKTAAVMQVPWDSIAKEINSTMSLSKIFKERVADYKSSIKSKKAEILRLKGLIREKNLKNKKINKKGDWEDLRHRIKEIEEHIELLIKNLGIQTGKLAMVQYDIKGNNFKKNSVKISGSGDINDKKFTYCENLLRFIEEFKLNLLSKNTLELTKYTEEYFRMLATEKNEELEKIDINDKFELKLLRKQTLDDMGLSEGEDLLFILAFSTALKKITNINAPFVIDSPIGKIDLLYRETVAKFYLKILERSQIILLATDSEFTGNFEKTIRKEVEGFTEYSVSRDKLDKSINSVTKKNGK
jgi:DNA sulfur modification protein DndD